MFEELFPKPLFNFIGIDISPSAVRLVELQKIRSGYRLTRFSVEPLSMGAVVEGNVQNSSPVINVLKKIRKDLNIAKNADVVVALNGQMVITKTFQLDAKLSEREIETQAWLEMSKSFPQMSTMEMRLDFNVLGKSVQNPAMIDVLLVAARVENVNERVNILSEAGFRPKIVGVDYFALVNACEFIFQHDELLTKDKTVAIFHLEYPVLTLIVVHDFMVAYVREAQLGRVREHHDILTDTGKISELSTKPTEISPSEKAAELPEDSGLEITETPSSEAKPIALKEKRTTEGIKEEAHVGPFSVENVISQMGRTLQFFYSGGDEYGIDRILLTGNVGKLAEHKIEIENETGINVIVANPFRTIEIGAELDKAKIEELAPVLTAAFGLALRGEDYATY